jgi:hypothetical protein
MAAHIWGETMANERPPAVRNLLGVLAAVSMLLGAGLAWARAVPAIVGFAMFALGGILGLGVAAASIVQRLRGRPFGVGGVAALVAAAVLVAGASGGRGKPRINDFTTNLDDPPAFADAAKLPANAGRDLAYPAAFAPIQRECCSDLRPARLTGPDAFGRARSVAEHMPTWVVTVADPATGTIEAISTSALFGFQDDVVIRLRPAADGSTTVDMRSKSRDGQGDLGVNANRIRAYVAAVEAGG